MSPTASGLRGGGGEEPRAPRPRARRLIRQRRAPPRRVFRGSIRPNAVIVIPRRAGPFSFHSRPDPAGPLATIRRDAGRHDLLPRFASVANLIPAGRTEDPRYRGRRPRRFRPVHVAAMATLVSTPQPHRGTCWRIDAGVPNRSTLTTHALAGMRPAQMVGQQPDGSCLDEPTTFLVAPVGMGVAPAGPLVGDEFEAAGECGPRGDDDLRPAAVAEA